MHLRAMYVIGFLIANAAWAAWKTLVLLFSWSRQQYDLISPFNIIDTTSTEPSSSHPPEPVPTVPTEGVADLPVVEPTTEISQRESPRGRDQRPRLCVRVGRPTRARRSRCSIQCHRSSRWTGTCVTHTRTTACSRPRRSSASSRSAGSCSPKSVGTSFPSSLPCSRSTMISRTSGDTRSSCLRTNTCRRHRSFRKRNSESFVPGRVMIGQVIIDHNPTRYKTSQRVRMRRKARLTVHWDDHLDSLFFWL